jgi:transposase
MRSAVERQSEEAEKVVRDIRRATRRQYTAEKKVRIVIAGLRGEESIAELCRKEGINQNLYYRWSKEFLEAGKKRLAGDTPRRSQGLAGGSAATEGIAGRGPARESAAQKSVIGDGESDT